MVYFLGKNKINHNMFYRAWPGSSFLHVALYFLCGINGNKHTLTYTGSQGIYFFNTWWICLLRFSSIVVVSARIVEWRPSIEDERGWAQGSGKSAILLLLLFTLRSFLVPQHACIQSIICIKETSWNWRKLRWVLTVLCFFHFMWELNVSRSDSKVTP